jgi:hypothetical protein
VWNDSIVTFHQGKTVSGVRRFNPDSAVEREVMSKEQTFRGEDTPFGIANGKSQIPKYGICNLRSQIPGASEDSLLQVCP